MRLSACLLSPLDDLPDRALLGRFLAEHDEAAFAALVQRHGPMVLGVCRRVLGDVHAAEDAFQATFLVLVRRAADATRDHLGPWLYGVAYRTALKARVAALRRAAREQKAAAGRPVMAPESPHGSPEVAELGSVLDEELGRLPGELRTAVVMCDLEGVSRREAARRLGWPESTLSSRLTLARDRLVKRLTRRGVAPVVAGLVAAVPPSLARATCAAAVSALTGAPPGVPAPVAQLSNEVIRTMTLPRKALAALVVSFAAVLVTGAAIVADSAPPPGAGPAQPRPHQSRIRTGRRTGRRTRSMRSALSRSTGSTASSV
jgi:RNA polymerase sigma factor (sigma-70 family)